MPQAAKAHTIDWNQAGYHTKYADFPVITPERRYNRDDNFNNNDNRFNNSRDRRDDGRQDYNGWRDDDQDRIRFRIGI
jgi:hypothetical protein